MLKIFAGLETADEGTVWVHKDVKVIMLQQDTAFMEDKSIRENVLRLDNPVIKTVSEYEKYLDEGIEKFPFIIRSNHSSAAPRLSGQIINLRGSPED